MTPPETTPEQRLAARDFNMARHDYEAKSASRMNSAKIYAQLIAQRPAPEPEPHGFLTVICGAVAVVILAMAFFNIPLWSN